MKIKFLIWILIIASLMAACSSSDSPQQIAAYLQEVPIAVFPLNLETIVYYHATLDLEVSNVDRAAERAKEIAFEQNGYLLSAQSWYQDGEKQTTLVLAVPANRFDTGRDDLLRLGSLIGEWISSDLASPGRDGLSTYSQITLYLHPGTSAFPDLTLPAWRPVRTFEKAWGVFVAIFGFLLDMIIWVVVLAGPFVLFGWGGKKLIQWWRK